jgi:hypothetical protein
MRHLFTFRTSGEGLPARVTRLEPVAERNCAPQTVTIKPMNLGPAVSERHGDGDHYVSMASRTNKSSSVS